MVVAISLVMITRMIVTVAFVVFLGGWLFTGLGIATRKTGHGQCDNYR